MRTTPAPTVIVDHTASHPAALAWMDFKGGAAPPERIEVFKRRKPEGKSAVYLLAAVGPNGTDIIAKESFDDDAEIERKVYTDVLPRLSVDGPGFIGWARSGDESRSWLFLEAIAGPRFSRADWRYLEPAAHWLALLHTETAGGRVPADLPRRGPEFYERLLHETVTELITLAATPAASPTDREVLERISTRLMSLIGAWARFAELYSVMPIVLVHGDFVAKNTALADTGGVLHVFDWAEAHWGPAAVDLWETEPVAYERALRELGTSPGVDGIHRWRRLGVLLRMILSVGWEVPRLHHEWTVRSMRRMTIYDEHLDAAMGTASGP